MIDLGFTQDNLELGGHIALLFDDDNDRIEIIKDFIKARENNNEKLMYLVDKKPVEEFKEGLDKEEIVYTPEDTQILSTDDGYCPRGYFSQNEMLYMLRIFTENALASGFSGGRASGEMTWALEKLQTNESLMKYESHVNEICQTMPFIAICQYDIRKFNGETIMDVFKTHPYIIIKKKLIKNPFFIKPEEFLMNFKTHPLK